MTVIFWINGTAKTPWCMGCLWQVDVGWTSSESLQRTWRKRQLSWQLSILLAVPFRLYIFFKYTLEQTCRQIRNKTLGSKTKACEAVGSNQRYQYCIHSIRLSSARFYMVLICLQSHSQLKHAQGNVEWTSEINVAWSQTPRHQDASCRWKSQRH